MTDAAWSGRRVTVMGLGLFGGGAGAARWALARGAEVTVTDLRDAEILRESVEALERAPGAERLRFALGGHVESDFADADVVVANPGVRPDARWLRGARDGGAVVTTATRLLLESLRARVVAITGTNGKSSTARFTRDLVAASLPESARVELGGNIGGSLLDRADDLGPGDAVVLELSSYQLEHLAATASARPAARADVVAITNVGVDHLDRHGTLDAYRDAKLSILDLLGGAGGTAIVPAGDLEARANARLGRPCIAHGAGGDVALDADGRVIGDARSAAPMVLGNAAELGVPGAFQRKNLAVALAVVRALGRTLDDLDLDRAGAAIADLSGLPHRLESLGVFHLPRAGRAVEIVDNGVSTTPESTLVALDAVTAEHPKGAGGLLVAGGRAKAGQDAAALTSRITEAGWTLVPFGDAAEDLAVRARASGAGVVGGGPDGWPRTVEEAADAALRAAERSDVPVVLFSPACASFDGYPNFEARARAFRGAIRGYAERHAAGRNGPDRTN
ncbi:MAG: UDP-N-acetylmuramoyl-L-alanine--D-glutamate ligase [Planctomycetota bacterium]